MKKSIYLGHVGPTGSEGSVARWHFAHPYTIATTSIATVRSTSTKVRPKTPNIATSAKTRYASSDIDTQR